jgi:DNA primase
VDVRYEIEGIIRNHLTGVGHTGPNDLAARCPFHRKADGTEERSASFAMNLDTGLYFCHSCGAKGNLYTFFRDLGLPRTEIQLNYSQLIDAAKGNLPGVQDPIKAQLFDNNPLDHRVLGMLDYEPVDLVRAGFTPETLRYFDIGYDRWHYRVTYPIRDLAGQLVAISGRTVIDAVPRYKIYNDEYRAWGLPPRTDWQRGNVLYNAHRLYAGLYHSREKADIIVVEGFKACMWVHQMGFSNVVALVGHYLTKPQQWILEDLAGGGGGTIYMFLDNNWQGWHGCETAGLSLARSTRVRVMMYPDRLRDSEDAQPDSCTPEEIRYAKENAIDFYSFRAFRG